MTGVDQGGEPTGKHLSLGSTNARTESGSGCCAVRRGHDAAPLHTGNSERRESEETEPNMLNFFAKAHRLDKSILFSQREESTGAGRRQQSPCGLSLLGRGRKCPSF